MDATIDTVPAPLSSGRNVVYEGLSIRLSPASSGKRFLAYAIDLGVVYAVFNIVIVAMIFLFALGFGLVGFSAKRFGELFSNESGSEAFGVLALLFLVGFVLFILLFFIVVYHGYFIYFEYKKGATPGKRIFGLKVVSADGSKLRVGQCILRDVLRYIDCMLIVPGLLCLILHSKKQRLGDMMAGTLVVHSEHSEKGSDFLYIKQEEFQYLREALSPKEIPVDVASEFLLYSYPRFISRKWTEDAATDEQWKNIALVYMPDAEQRGLDRESILLFFAEQCYQAVHTNQGT